MVTALARIEGRPLGIVANNPTHLAGAIDSDGADKAARFMQLCDAFDIPILFLCDTPGIMVGPEVEKTALVRHCCRLFVTGASLTVPFFTIVLRKGYGLGAQAMAGGSFKAPLFTVAWPTGEFGGMGLEGAVKLGYRNELAAIERPGRAAGAVRRDGRRACTSTARRSTRPPHFEIDDVIDPADSRRWIVAALASVAAARAAGTARSGPASTPGSRVAPEQRYPAGGRDPRLGGHLPPPRPSAAGRSVRLEEGGDLGVAGELGPALGGSSRARCRRSCGPRPG